MDYAELYGRAHSAGLAAATNTTPRPMMVGKAVSLFSNEIDKNEPVHIINDGVCGFAEVVIKPGNSRFANWLKNNNLAERRYYGGGVSVWVSEFGQSYERKMAYARAFAEVLQNAEIKATPTGRLD